MTSTSSSPARLEDSEAQQILTFWFGEVSARYDFDPEAAPRWFKKDPAFDEQVRHRFGALIAAAQEGSLEEANDAPRTRLAHILLLDQLSRNAYRDSARMYAGDERALTLVKDAYARGQHSTLAVVEQMFLVMTLMHSEALSDQHECVRVFQELLRELPDEVRSAPLGKIISEGLRFAELHRDIVERFGRFPHRNDLLGRDSTAEEQEFLRQPNSSF